MNKAKKVLHSVKNRRAKKNGVNEDVPRITNKTLAEHREQVLSGARKYVLPVHSKNRIVLLSVSIFVATLVVFFTYCTLALYRFQSNSGFLYKVTQVIPFPVARSGTQFIAYENYLFEMRHYTHYYETQLDIDFSNENERLQLEQFKRRALDKVVNDAYVKQLADREGVTVSDREVDDQITIARNQQRFGATEQSLEDVISDFWGWTIDDFRRTLRQQLLAQKVAEKLDTETRQQAEAALAELQSGADFAEVARKYSDDEATKENGGEFGFAVDKMSRELSPQSADILFDLEPGAYSDIVNTGYSLEIVRNIETNDNKVRAAHIVFNFEPIETHLNDLKAEKPYTVYVRLPEVPEFQDPDELITP